MNINLELSLENADDITAQHLLDTLELIIYSADKDSAEYIIHFMKVLEYFVQVDDYKDILESILSQLEEALEQYGVEQGSN